MDMEGTAERGYVQGGIGSRIFGSSHTYAIFTILAWSMVFLGTRVLLKSYTSSEVGFIRYFSASVFLVIAGIAGKVKRPAARDLPIFAFGGLTGFAWYVYAFNHAAVLMNSGTCSLVITTAPILTAVLLGLIYKEKISVAGWIAIALQFVGIAVMTVWNRDISVNQGIVWMATASVSLSLYNIIQKCLIKKGYSPIQITSYCIFSGTVLLAFTVPGLVQKWSSFGRSELMSAVYLGGVAGALAYLSWSRAIQIAPKASQVTNYMFLIPLSTAIVGYLAEGERMETYAIAGGAIIAVGFVVFILEKK